MGEEATSPAAALQDELDAFNAQVTKQGTVVRTLKKNGGSAEEIGAAVTRLKALKEQAALIQKQADDTAGGGAGGNTDATAFDRKVFDELLVRKMFVIPSFEIHGGVKGLFDLGPSTTSLKAAMVDLWRKHFVLTESMLEMECTNLTPAVVLKTSGHVDRFTDLMVRDPATGECFRADKLLEDVIDQLLDSKEGLALSSEQKEEHLRIQRQADAFSPEELDKLLADNYKCKAPSGQPYSPSFPFNLMFQSSIGPEGTAVGYLRPETAQGLFCNFRRLLDLNANKMPFAAAQIGTGFRNEIAPRSGLLRVREFCMAEIEHFVSPQEKQTHERFTTVADVPLVLFGRDDQLGSGKTKIMTTKEAVESGLIDNQTLAYFMARTYLYLAKIGVDTDNKVRFRQHLTTEMAHYATDCWDCEIKTSYGWVECVGHADRACYDLDVHSKATKTPMVATRKVDPPITQDVAKIKWNRKELGKVFKQEQRVVSGIVDTIAEKWEDFETTIAKPLEGPDGKTTVEGFEITKDMLTWTKAEKKVHEIKYTPSVVEPSFGMGRILYALLEHTFYQRAADEQRCVMKFNPQVAPEKCAVLPISSNPACNDMVDTIAAELMENDLATRVDKSSAALGRRYARTDELGVPFAITVDFVSVKDQTVTMRERDTMKQVRLPVSDVVNLIFKIVHKKTSWEDIIKKYPIVQVDEGEENGNTTATANASAEPGSSTVIETTARGRFRRPAVS